MTRDPRDARIQKLEERQRDMVHKAELRELIEDWRERAELHREFGYRECAGELEALLQE